MRCVIMLDIRHTSLAWMIMTFVICNSVQMIWSSGSFQVRVLSLPLDEFNTDSNFSKADDYRGGNDTDPAHNNSTEDTVMGMERDICSIHIEICLSHHLLPVPRMIECTLGKATRDSWHPSEVIHIPFSFKWPGASTASIKAISQCKHKDAKSNRTLSHLVFSHDVTPTQTWTRIDPGVPSRGKSTDTSDFRLSSQTSHTRDGSSNYEHDSVTDDSNSRTGELFDIDFKIEANETLTNKQTIRGLDSETRLKTNMDGLIQNSWSTKTRKESNGDTLITDGSKPRYSESWKVEDDIDSRRGSSEIISNSKNVKRDKNEMVLDIAPNKHTSISYRIEGQFSVIFRVICQRYYFGDGCSKFCRPKDDLVGHYTCSENGRKVCLDGWTGLECSTAVCSQACPLDQGTCTRPDVCTCKPGWYGYECEHCRTAPGCLHGVCRSAPGQCLCHKGWMGPLCDVEIQYCVDNQPCHNNGECVHDQAHNYTCKCTSGYTGTTCQVPVCHDNFCLNGGTCLTSEGTRYCLCLSPFKGPRCQHFDSEIGETVTKADSNVDIGMHQTGINAPLSALDDDHQDECGGAIDCLNGGKCVQSDTGESFGCECQEPYEGEFCEIDPRDPCEDYFCMNRGKCKVYDGEAYCICKARYSGEFCEVKEKSKRTACSNTICENGGTCIIYKRKAKCVCRKNFHGKMCEHNALKSKTKDTEKTVKVHVWTVRVSSPVESCACIKPYLGFQFVLLMQFILICIMNL